MLREILACLKSLTGGGSSPSTGERRGVIRVQCRYPVTCFVERAAFHATVVDMGVRGMRLQLAQRLRPKQIVQVQYSGAQSRRYSVDTVRCEVSWVRRTARGKLEVGLRYDDLEPNLERSWVKAILRELGFRAGSIFQRRKARRVVAMLHVKLNMAGHPPMTGRVLDLGVGGALLQVNEHLNQGQTLVMDLGPALGLRALPVSTEVVSCRYEPQSQTWFCGTRFLGLSDKKLGLISRYVEKLLKDTAD